jgi:hypothetical protein
MENRMEGVAMESSWAGKRNRYKQILVTFLLADSFGPEEEAAQ